eukprot:1157909-Pelagomonas_calceolata.AAC.8
MDIHSLHDHAASTTNTSKSNDHHLIIIDCAGFTTHLKNPAAKAKRIPSSLATSPGCNAQVQNLAAEGTCWMVDKVLMHKGTRACWTACKGICTQRNKGTLDGRQNYSCTKVRGHAGRQAKLFMHKGAQMHAGWQANEFVHEGIRACWPIDKLFTHRGTGTCWMAEKAMCACRAL